MGEEQPGYYEELNDEGKRAPIDNWIAVSLHQIGVNERAVREAVEFKLSDHLTEIGNRYGYSIDHIERIEGDEHSSGLKKYEVSVRLPVMAAEHYIAAQLGHY